MLIYGAAGVADRIEAFVGRRTSSPLTVRIVERDLCFLAGSRPCALLGLWAEEIDALTESDRTPSSDAR